MEKIYYLPTHEYVKVEGEYGYIGITDYAAKQLGAVTYVDVPEEGDEVEAGVEFGAVESRKAASDLYSPVSGEVVEINDRLEDNPKLINEDAMANWIIKVKLSDLSELEKLLDEKAYAELCEKEH